MKAKPVKITTGIIPFIKDIIKNHPEQIPTKNKHLDEFNKYLKARKDDTPSPHSAATPHRG